MASFDVNNIEGTFSTCDDEGELIDVKAMEHVDRVLVDVLRIRVVDPFSDFPILDKEEMFLSAVEDEMVFSILTNSLNGFNLK